MKVLRFICSFIYGRKNKIPYTPIDRTQYPDVGKQVLRRMNDLDRIITASYSNMNAICHDPIVEFSKGGKKERDLASERIFSYISELSEQKNTLFNLLYPLSNDFNKN